MEEFVAILAENSPFGGTLCEEWTKGESTIGRFYKKRFTSLQLVLRDSRSKDSPCIKKNFTTRITFLPVSFLDYRSPCHFAQNIERGEKMDRQVLFPRVSISYIACTSPRLYFCPRNLDITDRHKSSEQESPHPMNPPSCSVYYAPLLSFYA